jgi:hypothetical protein
MITIVPNGIRTAWVAAATTATFGISIDVQACSWKLVQTPAAILAPALPTFDTRGISAGQSMDTVSAKMRGEGFGRIQTYYDDDYIRETSTNCKWAGRLSASKPGEPGKKSESIEVSFSSPASASQAISILRKFGYDGSEQMPLVRDVLALPTASAE